MNEEIVWQTPEEGAATGVVNIDERTNEGSVFSFARMRFRYRYALKYVQPGTVLDIGCGLGFGCEHFPPSRFHYVGIDYSDATVAQARGRYPHVNFEVMAVPPLQYAEGSFRNILCLEVIEHLPLDQVSTLLRECCRVLQPGGVLFLTTPNVQNRGVMPHAHVYEYSVRELRDVVATAGFRIVHQGGLFLRVYGNRYKPNWGFRLRAGLYHTATSAIPAWCGEGGTGSVVPLRRLSKRALRYALSGAAHCLNWGGYVLPRLAEYQVVVATKEHRAPGYFSHSAV